MTDRVAGLAAELGLPPSGPVGTGLRALVVEAFYEGWWDGHASGRDERSLSPTEQQACVDMVTARAVEFVAEWLDERVASTEGPFRLDVFEGLAETWREEMGGKGVA